MSSISTVDVDPLIDTDIILSYKTYCDGNLSFKPVIFSSSDLSTFSINQNYSRKKFLILAEKEEIFKAPSATKWTITIKHSLHKGLVDIMDAAEKRVSTIETGARFQDLFGVLNYKLIYSCFCLLHNEGEKPVYGEMFITKSFVGFYGFNYNTKNALRVCITFSEVQIILKAAIMKKPGFKHKTIVPLTDPKKKPSVLLFCTLNHQVFQFYGFSSKYDSLCKLCLNKWKESQIY